MSQETIAPKILQSLVDMQKEISETGIAKELSAKDKQGKELYKTRGIDAVYNLLSPLFSKHRIVLGVNCLSKEREVIQVKSSIQFQTFVQVEYTFKSCLDGSEHSVTMYGEASDYSDKGIAKALSMAFKYACFQVFCIPVCDDPDMVVHERISNQEFQDSRQNINHSIDQMQAPVDPLINKKQADYLTKLAKSIGQDINEVLAYFNIKDLSQLKVSAYKPTIKNFEECHLKQMQAQSTPALATKEQIDQLCQLMQQHGHNPEKLLKRFSISHLSQLTASAHKETLDSINKYLREEQQINQQQSKGQHANATTQQRNYS